MNTPNVGDHAATPAPFYAKARKFLVSACGVAGMVVSTGALDEHAALWVNAALAVATALGVYVAPNRPSVG